MQPVKSASYSSVSDDFSLLQPRQVLFDCVGGYRKPDALDASADQLGAYDTDDFSLQVD